MDSIGFYFLLPRFLKRRGPRPTRFYGLKHETNHRPIATEWQVGEKLVKIWRENGSVHCLGCLLRLLGPVDPGLEPCAISLPDWGGNLVATLLYTIERCTIRHPVNVAHHRVSGAF